MDQLNDRQSCFSTDRQSCFSTLFTETGQSNYYSELCQTTRQPSLHMLTYIQNIISSQSFVSFTGSGRRFGIVSCILFSKYTSGKRSQCFYNGSIHSKEVSFLNGMENIKQGGTFGNPTGESDSLYHQEKRRLWEKRVLLNNLVTKRREAL